MLQEPTEKTNVAIGLIRRITDLHNCTIAFWVGPWVVTTYAFLAGTAFFVGCITFLWFVARTGGDPVRAARLQLLITLPCAFVGLRLFTILTELPKLFANPLATIIRPGYMLHGGIAGGLLALAFSARLTGTPLLVYLDGAALALSIGEAIARIGCHVYGCCWGSPTTGTIGIRYTSEHSSVLRSEPHLANVKLHPAQLYSALFSLLLWLLLLLMFPHRRFDGMLVATYCVLHSAGRLCLEQLRQDNRGKLWGPWTHTMMYSLVMMATGIAIWIRGRSLPPVPISEIRTQIQWIDVATNIQVLAWVIPFSLIFFFAYGVHYKAVGSWFLPDQGTDL